MGVFPLEANSCITNKEERAKILWLFFFNLKYFWGGNKIQSEQIVLALIPS